MVNLIFDREYGGYVADVPELPGCMSQGKTVEEAISNVKEAIALYVETQGSPDRPSPHPALTTVVEV
jgi:predicted RNase H-like HicB family nuclease